MHRERPRRVPLAGEATTGAEIILAGSGDLGAWRSVGSVMVDRRHFGDELIDRVAANQDARGQAARLPQRCYLGRSVGGHGERAWWRPTPDLVPVHCFRRCLRLR